MALHKNIAHMNVSYHHNTVEKGRFKMDYLQATSISLCIIKNVGAFFLQAALLTILKKSFLF